MDQFEKIVYPVEVICICGCNLRYKEVLSVTIKCTDKNTMRNPYLVGRLLMGQAEVDKN
jgi:ribosome biogenesis protein Nip4